ncbi:MAG TPA: Na+/H+ antiporter NhaA [Thermoanaerobaculia bacterium]|nr:Na+/H+ antiporter NhaA [Thermoanaerobaculia bacterium]
MPAVRLSPFLRSFLRSEALSGILLLAAAVAAIALANSPFKDAYHHAAHLPIRFGTGALAVDATLAHAINDGLMALFFLVVGLEIKREFLTGELSGRGAAILPVASACGGAAVPAVIYAAFNAGTPAAHGWGIPMATDIAFAVGVLALLGRHVAPVFKVFLTAVAVVDDLIAVLVIAFFYTSGLDLRALAVVAAAFAILLALNRAGVRALAPYLLVGAVLWAAMARSGVHATIAGVLLAMAIPATGAETSPLRRLEHALHPWVAYGIMPVFALANAGVTIPPGQAGDMLASPIALGIALGLFFGKQVGIFGTAFVLGRLGIGALPGGARGRRSLWGVALLGGIGFTMSLFVSGLAFRVEEMTDVSKAAILAGSLISGLAGAAVLASVPAPVAGDEVAG